MAIHPPALIGHDPPHELTDRVAVVTGASSGIGRAVALELAAGGADVLVHACSNRRNAEETANLVRQMGRVSEVILHDLTNTSEQDALVHTAWQWREIDIWINNAGVDVLTGDAATLSFDEKLANLWQVDVLGTIRLSRAVGLRMKKRGHGALLNMGWDQATTGMAGDSGEMFAVAKGAIMAFTRSLAKSLAPEVRVNCLAPGWIRTAWGKHTTEERQHRAIGESLLGRWGTPEDVSRVARFLVSDIGAFVNGQIIEINGGTT